MKENAVILGLQYGDEGKGRVSAYFSKDYDWSVRFAGGPNAGHTVYDHNLKEYKLHHLPSGAVLGKKVALHAGMVVNLPNLIDEYNSIENNFQLHISKDVHIINENHLSQDSSGSGIGSTKSGIAYVYSDRALRKGMRFGEISDKIDIAKVYSGLPPINNTENALFEGAQGIMLDIDYGDYPYVTSSSVLPSIAHNIKRKIGVMKAYTTRVGDGPPYWPDISELRVAGNEFGTTTSRARKCTWNDKQQLDYALSIVQPDEIVVTKLDILKNVKNICIYDNGKLKNIGKLEHYKDYLIQTFPKIKWFSESPYGELTKVG